MDDLPDKIMRIDVLKVAYGRRKLCECRHPHYEIDTQNHLVTCVDCGAIADPFEAFRRIAEDYTDLNKKAENLWEQRRELLNWEPRLIKLKHFAEEYRSGHGNKSMVPCCPHCGEPFDLPILNWCNRKFLKQED